MDQSVVKLRAMVRHEFGHVVAAKLLGFTTGSVTVTVVDGQLDEGRSEITLTPIFKDLKAVAEYAQRRIQVLYAGTGAEAFDGKETDGIRAEELLKTTAKNDHAKIRELLRIVAAIRHPGVIDYQKLGELTTMVDTGLRLKSGDIVEQHGGLIVDLTEFFIKQMKKRSLGATFTLPSAEIDSFPGVASLPAQSWILPEN
jgi:hypothetical protein